MKVNSFTLIELLPKIKSKVLTLYCFIWCVLLLVFFSQTCFGIANPVGWWKFDAGSGTSCVDSSGNGNTGTINGTLSWRAVNSGYCLYFNGTNSYVDCGNGSVLDITGGALSMSAWICPDATQTYDEPGICGKGFYSYFMSYDKYQDVRSYISAPGHNAYAHIYPGQWHHVAVTFDGSIIKQYVNGQLAGIRDYSSANINSGSNFLIGFTNTTGALFKGYIDDVRVWNSTLSVADVASLFSASELNTRNNMSDFRGTYTSVTASQSITSGNLTVKVGNKGGIEIVKGTSPNTSSVVWNSRYSYPGTSIGYNWLSQTQTIHWPTPTVTKTNNVITISANDSGHYTLSRTVRINSINGNNRVEIQDTLTNTYGSPIGILIRNQLTSSSQMTNNIYGLQAACPLLFWTQTNADFAVVAEDNLGRLNFNGSVIANSGKIEYNNFALNTGNSYTFKYAIYPKTTTGDVYDAVNLIRKDWGSNTTINGPWQGMDINYSSIPWNDLDSLKRWIQRRNLNIAAISPWLDYDSGYADHIYSRSEYQTAMSTYLPKLKAANPSIKCLGSIETDWITIDPDNHTDSSRPMFTQSDGDAIKAFCAGTGSQTAADAAIANTIALGNLKWTAPDNPNNVFNFGDSIKRFSGQHVRFECYVRGGHTFYSLWVYPWYNGSSFNAQYGFLMNQNAFIMNTCGMDGFYEDEFSQSWGSTPQFSYGSSGEYQWDGNSVIINSATGAITTNLVNCSLVGITPRLNIMNAAFNNNKYITANTWPTSSYEQSLGCWRFDENWASVFADVLLEASGTEPARDPALFDSALGCPIGLGTGWTTYWDSPSGPAPADTAQGLMVSIMKYLRHGMVYYHYMYPELPTSGTGAGEYGPINHMFPITPQELHKGWIKGNERIIACVDLSNITWNNSSVAPLVHFFDIHGYEVAAGSGRSANITGSAGNWTVSVTLNDWNEFCVIEQSDGLVAHYKFDEGNGSVAIDSSGNSNTATINNGSYIAVNGGYALSFDGTNSYVNCGNSALLDMRQAVTVSAWVVPSAHQNYRDAGIVGKGIYSFLMTYDYLGSPSGAWWYINSGYNHTYSSMPSGNSWSLMTATYDGTTLKIYKNGVYQNQYTYSNSIASGADLLIGCSGVSSGVPEAPFKGLIDDVRVYNRCLSSTEVSALYSISEKSSRDAIFTNGAEDGLVARYKMDEGTGTTLTDCSGFGNTAMIHGASWLNIETNSYALDFDGVKDYVDCGSGRSLNVTVPITMIYWVCPWSTQYSTEAGIVGKEYSSFLTTHDTSYGNSLLYWYLNGASHSANANLAVGEWSQVAVTYDKSNIRVYINGSPEGQASYSSASINSGGNLYIGRSLNNGDGITLDYFKGLVDDVKIYNYCMSSTEISNQYNDNDRIIRNDIFNDEVEDSLVAKYTLSEGIGDTIADTSGHENYGVLSNNITWTTRKTGANALIFNGTSTYVNCGSRSSLDIRGPMTLIAWMCPESSQSYAESGVVGKGFDSYLLSWYIGWGSNLSNFYIDAGVNNTNYVLTPAAWTMVAAVFDPYNINANQRLQMYKDVNGTMTLVDTSPTLYSVINAGINLYLGCYDSGGNRTGFFNGKLGGIRIYNKALLDTEINDIYITER